MVNWYLTCTVWVAMIFFLLEGQEVEPFPGWFGENGVTKEGGKELTFSCLKKRPPPFVLAVE